MNKELILLLAQEAAEYCKTQPRDMWLLWEQKFAELIVQQCCNVVDDAVLHREPASTYVDKIKEHFYGDKN